MSEPRPTLRRHLLVAGTVAVSGCVSRLRRIEAELSGERATKQSIAAAYRSGIDAYNRGVGALERGLEQEAWAEKIERAERAVSHLEDGVASFESATDRSRDAGYGRAARICADATEKARLVLEAAKRATQSWKAHRDGDSDRGARLWDEYQQLRARARGETIRRLDRLTRVLGLDG